MEKYKKIYKGDVEITKIFVGNEKVWPSGPSLPTGIMTFEDAYAKTYCVNNWGSGGEITYEQARAVTDIGVVFRNKYNMVSFNELQYFTGITSIPYKALEGNSKLVSVVLPNTITSIGDYAFRNCTNLTSIEFPDSVTSIGFSAFYYCDKGLTSIEIPESVTSIGEAAFIYCKALTSVILKRTITPIITITNTNVFFATSASLVIQVPQARLAEYKTAANWSDYASKMVGY